MAGLIGKSTAGVGSDVVAYLKAVAEYFGISIYVTSGLRTADGQATAMFDNWVSMENGKVYTGAIGHDNVKKLDDWHATAHNPKAAKADQAQAKAHFLKLAKEKMGSRSRHTKGRAVDVRKHGIDARVYKAITMQLHEVKEGKRKDIYHFESVAQVPAVDTATKAKWEAIKNGKPALHHKKHPPGVVVC